MLHATEIIRGQLNAKQLKRRYVGTLVISGCLAIQVNKSHSILYLDSQYLFQNVVKLVDPEKLKRDIGTFGLAAGVINLIVGAGIFALPALVAILLGPTSIIAYFICGILVILIMLCFAEIGTQVTISGGPYAYIMAAFGPYFGFMANILFWFGYCVVSDAAIANVMADMIALKFSIFEDEAWRAVFFLLVFGMFGWINITGIRHGVRMMKILTLAKLIPLIFLVILGIFWIETDNLTMVQFPEISNLGQACILLFFAFGGGESALSTSGEIKNPGKTIPRGLLLGIGIVVLLYGALQLVSQGILGSELVLYQEAPLAEVARRIAGNPGASLLIALAAISIFGTLSGSIMQYPRILYAGGRDGFAPEFIARIHPKYATPVWAIIAYATFDFVFSVAGGFESLAIISSAALLIIYLGVVLATIKFRMKNSGRRNETFHLPGGLLIPIISVITICWFLIQLSGTELFGIIVFLIILTVIYFIIQRWKKSKIDAD